MFGFCYGGHPACWASAENPDLIVGGVVCHPSMQLETYAFGGDHLSLARSVKCPFLIAPAEGDLATFGPGTEFAAALGESSKGGECVITPYPEMAHGWVPRGDLSKPEVARDVEAVMGAAIAFFETTMA